MAGHGDLWKDVVYWFVCSCGSSARVVWVWCVWVVWACVHARTDATAGTQMRLQKKLQIKMNQTKNKTFMFWHDWIKGTQMRLQKNFKSKWIKQRTNLYILTWLDTICDVLMDKLCWKVNSSSKSVHNFHWMQAHFHVHKNIKVTTKKKRIIDQIKGRKKAAYMIIEYTTKKRDTPRNVGGVN